MKCGFFECSAFKAVALAAAALLAAGSGAATTARADTLVISVNFNGADAQGSYSSLPNPGHAVTTTAGAVQEDHWNNAPNPTGSLSGLLDSTGAATGAGLSYSANNLYNAYSSPPSGTGDAALMQGYLDYFSGHDSNPTAAPGTLVVSGLGAPFTTNGYSILVYQNTDSTGSFGYSATDSNLNTSLAYGLQTSGNGGNYPLGGTNGYVGSTSTNPAGPADAANYVILTGFNGSGFSISGLDGTTGDGRARVAGFQIVANPVPEPASLVLFGLGSVGLLAVARRRAAR